jgi:hypothetical protein
MARSRKLQPFQAVPRAVTLTRVGSHAGLTLSSVLGLGLILLAFGTTVATTLFGEGAQWMASNCPLRVTRSAAT